MAFFYLIYYNYVSFIISFLFVDNVIEFLEYFLFKAPVMELVDMRVLGTRAFSVSVRVRPGANF